MASGRYPRITVTEGPQPIKKPFQLSMEKLRDFSSDAPAQIRGSFENLSSEEQTVGFGSIQPYSSIWSEGHGWLVLIPSDRQVQKLAFGTDEQIIPDRPVDGCWQANLVHFVLPDVLRWQSLDAGECIQTDYTVLHYPEQEILEATMDKWVSNRPEDMSCLPAGKHRFTESFAPKVRAETTWEEFEWRYTLTIEE
ncbi:MULTISPECIES: hypothetical protein [Haloferax]|jgi:hypothetical protein|uniref:Uncharacterized protein n=1 Tax=Haloferax sp. Atlit-48N TaxID=2077198 RepID=A0ACD5HZA4_9EURY|nr:MULTISPECIES: hypothetical protein [Haloferax]RDZ32750.1 hypothetical protein DEQ67_02990 [Haloferax sp. Atlit-48N]RDZ37565.1 hypothetical protein C5B88_05575 [Haloferax sp. Atlit-24N]RDZ40938.1 hypothetical protein C5B89_02995 [Haloferax sp. Atlit-47N]RLM38361.1 hypothetical protein DVK03_05575 [Haloferax sp. Atlit-109R]RLM46305.1 hypothetical protein DVK04_05595 [Haloferax sp. Atlit-105R]